MPRKPANPPQAAEEEPAVVDIESRLPAGAHGALRLWLRMLSCTTLIETEIRSC
ncbi:MarR family transcriptional regulator, partial [Acinetobacter baumannii]|nr:MarR family transcriptional regulator [Acinetobacter baumannii]